MLSDLRLLVLRDSPGTFRLRTEWFRYVLTRPLELL